VGGVRVNKNSATYWFPKVKNLDVLVPQTEIIGIDSNRNVMNWLDNGVPRDVIHRVKSCVRRHFNLNYPIFMRTDLLSAKHDYEKTCLVQSEDEIGGHLYQLIMSHLTTMLKNGNELKAILVREKLDIKSKFTAFWDGLPIGVEVRHFISNGEWGKGHFYWPKKAIKNPSAENWEELLDQMLIEAGEGFKRHKNMAEIVAKKFEGNWSVDFAKTKSGKWYLIDMAVAEDSWVAEEESLYFENPTK